MNEMNDWVLPLREAYEYYLSLPLSLGGRLGYGCLYLDQVIVL